MGLLWDDAPEYEYRWVLSDGSCDDKWRRFDDDTTPCLEELWSSWSQPTRNGGSYLELRWTCE